MRRKKQRGRVSKKISFLRKENVPEDQAVAEALSMERAGRLDQNGAYRRVNRKRRRGGSRA